MIVVYPISRNGRRVGAVVWFEGDPRALVYPMPGRMTTEEIEGLGALISAEVPGQRAGVLDGGAPVKLEGREGTETALTGVAGLGLRVEWGEVLERPG